MASSEQIIGRLQNCAGDAELLFAQRQYLVPVPRRKPLRGRHQRTQHLRYAGRLEVAWFGWITHRGFGLYGKYGRCSSIISWRHAAL